MNAKVLFLVSYFSLTCFASVANASSMNMYPLECKNAILTARAHTDNKTSLANLNLLEAKLISMDNLYIQTQNLEDSNERDGLIITRNNTFQEMRNIYEKLEISGADRWAISSTCATL